jgi:hypothetical protein
MRRLTLLVPVLFALGVAAPSHALPGDSVSRAAAAAEHTVALDLDLAQKELEGGDPDSVVLTLERARLAIYRGDCDGAVQLLSRPDIARDEHGETLADIARGCARATAATVMEKDDAHAIEIRYQDEHDRAMTPLVVETTVKARDALTRDLGVNWPRPTRIVVVRDLVSLSAMTGLPYEAASTTGTVAVAKWGRVTILSPRASHHGYAWRDTLTHELTHLAVTRATVDRAPLWLQEGVAKREEVRWRDSGPFDDRPPVDSVVERGIEMKIDLPLDKLGPSIAMLPSADAAMVAFAEVTSFVRYLAASSGPEALPRLFLGLKNKKSVDDALVDATGSNLKQWDGKWRANLTAQPKETNLLKLLGLGGAPSNMRDTRDRHRLAELLLGREHPQQALEELDAIQGEGTSASSRRGQHEGDLESDPSLRYVRARVLEALARTKDGEGLVGDPKEVAASYAPWWAIRGRWARARGDAVVADPSFIEAVAQDPFDVEAACESLDPASAPSDPAAGLLCEAARKMGEPPLGKD